RDHATDCLFFAVARTGARACRSGTRLFAARNSSPWPSPLWRQRACLAADRRECGERRCRTCRTQADQADAACFDLRGVLREVLPGSQMTAASSPHATVIGAGIVGISTAAFLQRAGFRVTVI